MENNLYPLTFYPIYKDYIWGGTNLSNWGKIDNHSIIAESWEISNNKKGESIISNGFYKNISLNQILKKFDNLILGDNYSQKSFPLLIKFIDAKENLSIQVHPNDDYAKIFEKLPYGKNEMWYILECDPESYIYYGLINGTTKDDIFYSINNISNIPIENYLQKKYVNPGDTIYIPAGTIHAITKGITLLEIQQNSDITYRLYDYNRKDNNGNLRELHIKKALEVISYNNNSHIVNTNKSIINFQENNYYQTLLTCPYFTAELWHIEKEHIKYSDMNKFSIYTVIKGSGKINEFAIKKGDTILIPAYLGKYTLSGNIDLIKSTPN